MKNKFLLWRYLGGTKETLLTYGQKVYENNLSFLSFISGFTSIVGAFSFILFLFLDFQLRREICLGCVDIASFAVYFISRYYLDHETKDIVKKTNILIVAYLVAAYVLFITAATINLDMPGVLITAVLLGAQVCFDLFPMVNFVTTMVAYLAFMTLVVIFKEPTAIVYDFVDASLVTALGLVFSWRKSRNAWEHAIAVAALSEQNKLLYESSVSDPLTGLPNRRNAFEDMSSVIRRANRSLSPFACMIIDIDSFKLYNEKYGHPAGDEVLRLFGIMLGRVAEEHSIRISRIGGGEFMAYWIPETNNEVSLIANEILKGITRLPSHGDYEYPTVSIGIYKDIPSAHIDSVSAYNYADKALYLAKENGKNRIEYYRA